MKVPGADQLETRRSLLSRLRNFDDDKSWRSFFSSYGGLIRGFAVKAGLSACEADEVVQNTLITVSKHIREFKYDPARGSFKGWLLQITRCRVADQFRRRSTCVDGEGGATTGADSRRTRMIERIPDERRADLDLLWDAEWQGVVMSAACTRVKEEVSSRQYQIFDLHVLKGWPSPSTSGRQRLRLTPVSTAWNSTLPMAT